MLTSVSLCDAASPNSESGKKGSGWSCGQFCEWRPEMTPPEEDTCFWFAPPSALLPLMQRASAHTAGGLCFPAKFILT